jgi:hypothetical protein
MQRLVVCVLLVSACASLSKAQKSGGDQFPKIEVFGEYLSRTDADTGFAMAYGGGIEVRVLRGVSFFPRLLRLQQSFSWGRALCQRRGSTRSDIPPGLSFIRLHAGGPRRVSGQGRAR